MNKKIQEKTRETRIDQIENTKDKEKKARSKKEERKKEDKL